MEKISRLSLVLFLISSTSLFAQNAQMADTMRSEGKIYVLVAIILVIFFGLIAYLFYTDRKISRLEKKLE